MSSSGKGSASNCLSCGNLLGFQDPGSGHFRLIKAYENCGNTNINPAANNTKTETQSELNSAAAATTTTTTADEFNVRKTTKEGTLMANDNELRNKTKVRAFKFCDMNYSESFFKKKTFAIDIPFKWSPTRFTVNAIHDNFALHKNLPSVLRNYANELTKSRMTRNYDPEEGEVVLTYHVGIWKRAVVTQVMKNMVKLVFIDVGGSETVLNSQLIPSNEDICRYPVYGMIVNIGANFRSNGTEPKLVAPTPNVKVTHQINYVMEFKDRLTVPQPGNPEPFITLTTTRKVIVSAEKWESNLYLVKVEQ